MRAGGKRCGGGRWAAGALPCLCGPMHTAGCHWLPLCGTSLPHTVPTIMPILLAPMRCLMRRADIIVAPPIKGAAHKRSIRSCNKCVSVILVALGSPFYFILNLVFIGGFGGCGV